MTRCTNCGDHLLENGLHLMVSRCVALCACCGMLRFEDDRFEDAEPEERCACLGDVDVQAKEERDGQTR